MVFLEYADPAFKVSLGPPRPCRAWWTRAFPRRPCLKRKGRTPGNMACTPMPRVAPGPTADSKLRSLRSQLRRLAFTVASHKSGRTTCNGTSWCTSSRTTPTLRDPRSLKDIGSRKHRAGLPPSISPGTMQRLYGLPHRRCTRRVCRQQGVLLRRARALRWGKLLEQLQHVQLHPRIDAMRLLPLELRMAPMEHLRSLREPVHPPPPRDTRPTFPPCPP